MSQHPFDKQKFRERFAGIEDIGQDLIRDFISAAPKLTNAVEVAVQKGDGKGLRIAAHTLKGVISNFYAEPSGSLAFALEKMGHDSEFELAQQTYDELLKELSLLIAAVSELVEKRLA